MVRKVSSQLYLPNECRIPISRNHSDMVKFLAPSDAAYRTVSSNISTEVNDILNRRSKYSA